VVRGPLFQSFTFNHHINKEITLNNTIVSEMITELAREKSLTAYQITTLYPKAETPNSASHSLKRAVPNIFNELVHSHWRRPSIVNTFYLFSFLDEPGSRYRPQDKFVRIESVQDDYHHHSILLVETPTAERIDTKFPWIRNPNLPRTDAVAFAQFNLSGSGLRSCDIRHLPSFDDIARSAAYSAKSSARMSELYPDDYLLIAPFHPKCFTQSGSRSECRKNRSHGERSSAWAPEKINYYEPKLRGPAQNRWGGHQTQRLRTYGGKFGAANKGRRLTSEEIKEWESASSA
jgi:hypothetical protein